MMLLNLKLETFGLLFNSLNSKGEARIVNCMSAFIFPNFQAHLIYEYVVRLLKIRTAHPHPNNA